MTNKKNYLKLIYSLTSRDDKNISKFSDQEMALGIQLQSEHSRSSGSIKQYPGPIRYQ